MTPQEVALALVSVIQALATADPVLSRWLDAALERYQEATA